MSAATSPVDETERLAALRSYKVLDTQPEPGFDQITKLAAHLCEAPIALVSLVDDCRQWFKSSYGLDATETPRDQAFCAHAILESEPLIIEDTMLDDRFCDNPLVLGGPKIRYYAGAPLVNPEGFALGTLCVIDDAPGQRSSGQIEHLTFLAEQVKVHLELRRTLVRAESATLAKSQFLSVMGHELRTPLNGILGMSDLLADSPLTADQADFVDIIQVSGVHLQGVLDDILEIATFESGTFTLNTVPFDLRHLVADVIDISMPSAKKKNLDLHAHVRSDLSSDRLGDPLRLREILIKLVGNAVKFTSKGTVALKIDGDDDALRLTVTDTGIGIQPEALPTIFDRFTQADNSSTRPYGGTGAGLAIVDGIVKAMGGKIEATSTPNAGSEFRVNIPLQTQSAR